MNTLIYDGTFEGFLTAVFHIYENKLNDAQIWRKMQGIALFGSIINIETDLLKAERVWTGLSKKLSHDGLHSLYCSHMADSLNEENNMLAYIRHALSSNKKIENDYSNFAVLRMQRVEKMVHRERHRMKAFIRFKLTKDNIYYATIEPDFNVLPMIKQHFETRYADQKWLIYDLRRGYGLYYDMNCTEMVKITFDEDAKNESLIMDEKEELYQTLWQQYFKSTNISSRKNMKLHIQHMPKRYWKYLLEKHITGKDIV